MVVAGAVPYSISTVILVLYMYADLTKTRSYSLPVANINMLAMLTIGGIAQVSV